MGEEVAGGISKIVGEAVCEGEGKGRRRWWLRSSGYTHHSSLCCLIPNQTLYGYLCLWGRIVNLAVKLDDLKVQGDRCLFLALVNVKEGQW